MLVCTVSSLKTLHSSPKSLSAVLPRSRLCTQQICNKIFIALVILRICILIEKLSVAKRILYIRTPGWHPFNFITFSSLTVTRWHRWHSGRRCGRFWWRCVGSFVPSACLQIHCCAILAWKAAVCVILINHCQVSFYRSLHLFMPRKLYYSLLLFLDFGARFLDQVLHFAYWGAQQPSFPHFGNIQSKAHVRLFWLYPTSLPRHSTRHVGNLEQSSCCV